MLAALQPARRRRRRPGKLRGLKIRVNLRPKKNSKDGRMDRSFLASIAVDVSRLECGVGVLCFSPSPLNADSGKEMCPPDRFHLSLSLSLALSSVPMGKFIGIEGARPPIAPSIDWVWEAAADAAAAPEVSSSFRSLSLGGQSAPFLPPSHHR